MKRALILFLIVLFLNLSSASYECSDGTKLISDQKEINLYQRVSITGIKLSLIFSDEVLQLNKYYAKVITDSEKFAISGENLSVDVEIQNDVETVKVLNQSSSGAEIKVDGDSEFVDEGESESIGDYTVFLIKSEGEYPNTTNVEGILGDEIISLDNANPSTIITLDEKEYLLELISASDDNAIFSVGKCENESATIKKINDVANNSVANITANDSVQTNITNVPDALPDETENITTFSANSSNGNSAKAKEKNFNWTFFILAGIIVVIMIVLTFLLMKNLKQGTSESPEQKPNMNNQD